VYSLVTTVYDEDKEKVKFDDLPDDWRCPVCNSPKSVFVLLEVEKEELLIEHNVSEIIIEQMLNGA